MSDIIPRPTDTPTPADALVLLEEGRRFLAEARAVGDVKQLRDTAALYERYLRQQKYAAEACQDAAELKLRAERRLGELLAGTVRPGNPQLSHDATIGRLPEGVSRSQSHRWQRVARLPEDVFEAEIAAGRKRGDLNTNALLKLAHREVKQRRHEEVRRRMAEAAQPTDLIRTGDFRVVLTDLADESVDLIFTDPPYLTNDLPIYSDLGAFAKCVLKPGGSLVCYAPTYNLMAVTDQVRQYLDFWTPIVIQHAGPASRLNHYHVVTRCKHLLWFVKGRYEGEWVTNLILGTRPDKEAHDWQQGEGEASYVIKRMTRPGDLIVDPMCGSATTLRAGLFLGRRTLGCEIDQDRSRVASFRCDLRAEAATFNPLGWNPWRRVVWLGLLTIEQQAGPVECCPAEWSPAKRGIEKKKRRLFVRGNKKVGRGVLVWNLPVFHTCPGATASCKANCYADRGNSRWPSVKRRHARNLRAAKDDSFVERAIAELRERDASKVRIHSSGDFYSPKYVLKWFAIAAALPSVDFVCYTRSWRKPKIRRELVRLATLSNVQVWFSCDRDTGLPDAVPNVRACFLQIEDELPPAPLPGQMAIARESVAFRTKREGREPATRIGLAMVCPTYNGLPAAAGVTCETCEFCFK